MEHLQGLMELLSCFIPSAKESELTVTAIKAFEPSMTEKDIFIGLNNAGRLVNVEEESTVLHGLSGISHSQTIQLVYQELLPLSMYLRAVGANVKAYRMRGDPREFPKEIRHLTGKSPCNLVIFPWRASQYVESLFWGSMRSLTTPIALIVMLDTRLTPTITDRAIGVVDATRSRSESVSSSVRQRSESLSASIRQRTTSGGSENDPDDSSTQFRKRAESILTSIVPDTSSPSSLSPSSLSPSPPNSTLSKLFPTSQESKKLLLSNQETSFMEEGSGILGQEKETSELPVGIKSIMAVVTGSPMCIAMFPLILRFSERNCVKITVLVTSDRRNFPQNLIEALAAFRQTAESISNITIEVLITPSTDTEAILQYCSRNSYDLIIYGFNTEAEVELCDKLQDTIPPPIFSRTQLPRSTSMSAQFAALSLPVIDSSDLRRLSGLPECLIGSPLLHPELGLLGNRIKEDGLSSFLMVIHEPYNTRQRRSTIKGSSPVKPTYPGVSSGIINGLTTIVEEKSDKLI
jgi:hypothetical protein